VSLAMPTRPCRRKTFPATQRQNPPLTAWQPKMPLVVGLPLVRMEVEWPCLRATAPASEVPLAVHWPMVASVIRQPLPVQPVAAPLARAPAAAPLARQKPNPAMDHLLDTLANGREEQREMLVCLVSNAWKPGTGNTFSTAFVERRNDAIGMITALHSWAVVCVGATNCESPGPRDCMHRSKGAAVTSMADNMRPRGAVIESSFHIWSHGVAVLDKFLCAAGYQLKETVDTEDERHTLLLCACASYVVAWKYTLSSFDLLMEQVYECLLVYYSSTGSQRGGETFKTVELKHDAGFLVQNPRRPMAYTKTTQGLSLEAAELHVLRTCEWAIGISTMPDAIDAMLGTKVDTDLQMAQTRAIAYDRAMRLTADANIIYSSGFLVLMGAFSVLCEAALTTEVPIKTLLRLAA
jgi:hypothetical protein